ncbi:hypothetical protein BH10PAT3_BH10PAT3_6390 [soil metagenome]
MPVAFCKGIFTWQLVAKAEVRGSPKVSRIPPGVPHEIDLVDVGTGVYFCYT